MPRQNTYFSYACFCFAALPARRATRFRVTGAQTAAAVIILLITNVRLRLENCKQSLLKSHQKIFAGKYAAPTAGLVGRSAGGKRGARPAADAARTRAYLHVFAGEGGAGAGVTRPCPAPGREPQSRSRSRPVGPLPARLLPCPPTCASGVCGRPSSRSWP